MPVGRTTVLEVDELGIEMIVEEEVGLKREGRVEETSVRNLTWEVSLNNKNSLRLERWEEVINLCRQRSRVAL